MERNKRRDKRKYGEILSFSEGFSFGIVESNEINAYDIYNEELTTLSEDPELNFFEILTTCTPSYFNIAVPVESLYKIPTVY